MIELKAPGSWMIESYTPQVGVMRYYFKAMCPCGCGDEFQIPIDIGVKKDHHWLWDGNSESPTLIPSIARIGGCAWHGFFQQGKWNYCAGSKLAPDCVSPGKQV